MTKPKARTAGLVVETVDDGLFVVDEERKSAHLLQRAAAYVWQHANGERSAEELADLLQADIGAESAPEIVRLSLDLLQRAHLLEEAAMPAARLDGISRRQLLAAAGMTSVALVTSISLPARAGVISAEV